MTKCIQVINLAHHYLKEIKTSQAEELRVGKQIEHAQFVIVHIT